MKLLKDLFYGPGNHFLDLGRLVAFAGLVTSIAAAGWNVYLHQPFDLGPTGFLGGMAAVISAGAALIGAKAWERRQSAKSENEAAAVAAVTGEAP